RSTASPVPPTDIASCRTWRASWGFARDATATMGGITSKPGRTPTTPILPSIRPRASSAPPACGALARQKGRSAPTTQARGFDSKVSASQDNPFMDSECVSCGACVQACPTATLTENSIIEKGQAEHSVITTCAYCGVGCSFRAEMKGEEVVRMVPNKD